MSVDVEDYFQVSAFDRVGSRAGWGDFSSRVIPNTHRLLELFDRAGVRSTFFILGWVAQRFPSLVREIAHAGHEIASHGYHHQLLYTLTPAQLREDVHAAKFVLEQTSGSRVMGFRAPSFSIVESSLWRLDILIEEGYDYDASIFPIRHDRHGIPTPSGTPTCFAGRRTLIEMPASTTRIGNVNLPRAGGGYFRLPPSHGSRWGISRVNRLERKPVCSTCIRGLDPDQPRFAVGAATDAPLLRASPTSDWLNRLLADFRFTSVASVLNLESVDTPSGA